MNNLFPPSVEKIVADYLERLSARLKGMPESDRRELSDEIRSHIYESYQNEAGSDEIGRILAVLRRLGEPAEVISSRVPRAIARVAGQRKAPLYILAGVLIALFGAPLGLGALGLLVGLLAGLVALLAGYFITAASLTVCGTLAALVCIVAIAAPDFILSLNQWLGHDVIQFGPFHNDPVLGGIIGLVGSLFLTALGLAMLWSGKHIWRGFRFVVLLIAEKVRRFFARRNGNGA